MCKYQIEFQTDSTDVHVVKQAKAFWLKKMTSTTIHAIDITNTNHVSQIIRDPLSFNININHIILFLII